ncbi:hypothetical protein L486_05941 [Kwoniella mangroviensis CBS 10435]|uniref:CAP-Gly domain-containing protein n=1 Tax=Kwoniella mangroviensis CBS 10435 TaxID=1331196 RepID=A0A1B9IND5_9TREE|nr:hypothetical protein L486_05941 [Kwoniella mangroviensis CBS 10435]
MSSPSINHIPYTVGNRYLNSKTNHPLTLRYIGSLPPSTSSSEDDQIWLGVEYDDPSNGKHNGSYKDNQVFQTVQDGSGSFIKYIPNSRGGPLKEGNSLISSIQDRYGSILPNFTSASSMYQEEGQDDSINTEKEEKVILGSSSNAITVTLPNISSVKERVGRLEKIRNMGFEDEHISFLGGDSQTKIVLRERMKSLKWLNLSNNLLSTWDQIWEIVDIFEGLEVLTLSHSRIRPIFSDLNLSPDQNERFAIMFKRIKELHLSDCLLSWKEVCDLIPLFPNIETLHLEANKRLDRPSSIPQGALRELKELRFGGCPLSNWEETVTTLKELPRLENLDLSFTPLTTIPIFPTETNLDNIKSLILLESNLSSWKDLDNLSICIPNLTNLRFTVRSHDHDDRTTIAATSNRNDETELNSVDDKSLRSICIALFPHLTSFNSNIVTTNERRDAELFFISFIQKQPEINKDWGKARYEELCKVHSVTQTVVDDNKGKKLKVGMKGRMITLKYHTSLSHSQEPDLQPQTISILPSAKISLLQRKLCKSFGLPIIQFQSIQIWNTKPLVDGSGLEKVNKVSVVWEDKDVGWWFEDGDEIFVECEDE